MGDIFDDGIENEKPIHNVQLDDFYIGKFPVTQAQWKSLVPDNPSFFQGDTLPVEQVTRQGAFDFIHKLTESNNGTYAFQLPTEAQWEYSARSGGNGEMYAGSHVADLVAWYDENAGGSTHPVGTKAPNGFGLYDMSGNVWEWCADTYREEVLTSGINKKIRSVPVAVRTT